MSTKHQTINQPQKQRLIENIDHIGPTSHTAARRKLCGAFEGLSLLVKR
ncbi:MAG: hypothetical protein WCI09_03510 [Planctomycetota bacterium]